jgi:hypothetical protein
LAYFYLYGVGGMLIKERCRCGAEFYGDAGSYINPGGVPDKNGDIFQVEKILREFRKIHSKCIEGKETVKHD